MAGISIAVVGVSCRLPCAPDPDAFWRLLEEGRDAIAPMPPGRRDPGRTTPAPPGGFLDEIDTFDAAFFGISPREAATMDPQQRLMLELGWEALEDAGIRPDTLAGSRTGVFAGAIWDEYATLMHRYGAYAGNRHAMTGVHRSIIANRLSYTLGLHGPSLTVDTAQSSSLVAVHMACESLRRGECDAALAGGVNLILGEDSMEAAAAQFGGLSPDGRCYTFDARANGFVRGEGGGAVLLKPLEAALRDGDRVYCVIRGGAVNNDGATGGLTAPGRRAQEDVIRLACDSAGVAPADVQYVELDGAGTPVGDSVEAAALGAALGRHCLPRQPLRVGSVKTNVGHLEGAAGVTGLLKVVLSIANRRLPPSLHFATPSPRIPLPELGLRVQDEAAGWPGPVDRPLIAGVSSFGMGGTNCHLVLAEEPVEAPFEPDSAAPPIVPWLVSGKSPDALHAQAGRLHAHVSENPGLEPADVGYSLATTRHAFGHRMVVLGRDRETLLERLAAVERGADAPGVIRGTATGGGIAVLFSGEGGQRPGMGCELHAAYPEFATALDDVCAELAPHVDRPLRETMLAPAATLAHRTAYTQPALFALEVALYRLAESWGLSADYLMGHSVGEIAAAHVAGALSLRDAATLVAARSRLMDSVPAAGAPDGVLDELKAVVAGLSFAAPKRPVISTVTGRPVTRERLASPGHWAENVRQTVRFTAGVRWMRDEGVTTFIELGPDNKLAGKAGDCLAGSYDRRRSRPAALAVLRRDRPEVETFASAMAKAYVRGADLTWAHAFGRDPRRRVPLPTYAFQRRRYWFDAVPDRADSSSREPCSMAG